MAQPRPSVRFWPITFPPRRANAIDSGPRSGNIHAIASNLDHRHKRAAGQDRSMIDLHYWTTPNGHKITMFLEETGLPYRIIPVKIGAGEQFKTEILAISPADRSEQSHPGTGRHRPDRRRRADLGVRIRRDPRLSGGEDRTLPAERAAC